MTLLLNIEGMPTAAAVAALAIMLSNAITPPSAIIPLPYGKIHILPIPSTQTLL